MANKNTEQSRKYQEMYPERWAANRAVYWEIRNNKIPPASECKCSVCESQARDYHHPSYDGDKHFDVIPLCATHHAQLHHGYDIGLELGRARQDFQATFDEWQNKRKRLLDRAALDVRIK